MHNKENELVDFAVTARKYKTLLTKKFVNRPTWIAPIEGEVKATLPGTVISIDTKVGNVVKKGQVLMIQEAMKMQNRICAPISGTIQQVCVEPGMRVTKDFVMIVIG
ncbi:MAG: biotin/lipoyl-containing protein [Bacteroidales bacterium]